MSRKQTKQSMEEQWRQQRRQFGEDLHQAKIELARRLRKEASEGGYAQARDCAETLRIMSDISPL